MQKRGLGTRGPDVSAVGLGCMGTTSSYGPTPDRQEMVSLLRSAVELGATFFDTAEVYGPFVNEKLVGEALAPFREQVVFTKFGFALDPAGEREQLGVDSRPKHIKEVAEGSLTRVNVEAIGDLLRDLGEGRPAVDQHAAHVAEPPESPLLHSTLNLPVDPSTLSKRPRQADSCTARRVGVERGLALTYLYGFVGGETPIERFRRRRPT